MWRTGGGGSGTPRRCGRRTGSVSPRTTGGRSTPSPRATPRASSPSSRRWRTRTASAGWRRSTRGWSPPGATARAARSSTTTSARPTTAARASCRSRRWLCEHFLRGRVGADVRLEGRRERHGVPAAEGEADGHAEAPRGLEDVAVARAQAGVGERELAEAVLGERVDAGLVEDEAGARAVDGGGKGAAEGLEVRGVAGAVVE